MGTGGWEFQRESSFAPPFTFPGKHKQFRLSRRIGVPVPKEMCGGNMDLDWNCVVWQANPPGKLWLADDNLFPDVVVKLGDAVLFATRI